MLMIICVFPTAENLITSTKTLILARLQRREKGIKPKYLTRKIVL